MVWSSTVPTITIHNVCEREQVAPELSFLCISLEDSKVTVFAYVTADSQAAGLKANDWVARALSAIGGKGNEKM